MNEVNYKDYAPYEFEKYLAKQSCFTAISHFDSVPGLLYLVYAERKMNYEDGKQYVKEKLERSFSKLSVQSKEYYKNKYQQVMEILGK